MKKTIFLFALIFSAVLFYNNSYSQEKDDCCSKDGSASSCDMASCDDMTSCDKEGCDHSSSGSVQAMTSDSLESDTETKTAGQVCPVSGEEIPAGGGVTITYLNKDYTFCCRGCVAAFMEEPMDYADGLTCPTEGDAVTNKEISAMHDGMKYYFCCEGCGKEFLSDPDKYLSKKEDSSEDPSKE